MLDTVALASPPRLELGLQPPEGRTLSTELRGHLSHILTDFRVRGKAHWWMGQGNCIFSLLSHNEPSRTHGTLSHLYHKRLQWILAVH
jgi:hypothetical protein